MTRTKKTLKDTEQTDAQAPDQAVEAIMTSYLGEGMALPMGASISSLNLLDGPRPAPLASSAVQAPTSTDFTSPSIVVDFKLEVFTILKEASDLETACLLIMCNVLKDSKNQVNLIDFKNKFGRNTGWFDQGLKKLHLKGLGSYDGHLFKLIDHKYKVEKQRYVAAGLEAGLTARQQLPQTKDEQLIEQGKQARFGGSAKEVQDELLKQGATARFGSK